MLTMTGFTRRTRRISCHTASEASPEPPGLSMRSTTARMLLRWRMSRRASTNVTSPTERPPNVPSRLLPGMMSPSATSSATCSPDPALPSSA